MFDVDKSQKSCDVQNSPDSGTQIGYQTKNSSENIVDFCERRRIRRQLYHESRNSSDSENKISAHQAIDCFVNKAHVKYRLESENHFTNESRNSPDSEEETDCSEIIIDLNKKLKNVKQLSIESRKSLDSDSQLISDQTEDSFDDIADLDKRLKSSLYISKKLESKSAEAKTNEQRNILQTSSFQEDIPSLYSQSNSKETPFSQYQSRPSKDGTLMSADQKLFFTGEKTANLMPDDVMQRSLLYSVDQTCMTSYSHKSTQDFVNTVPQQYFPGYHPHANPTLTHRNRNPIQYQASIYPVQYPEQSFMNPNDASLQEINRILYQSQPASSTLIRKSTVRTPIILSAGPSMHLQQFPQPNIRTRARPMTLSRRNEYYHNSMSPIKTRAIPIRYIRPTSHYRDVKAPERRNVILQRFVRNSPRVTYPVTPIQANTSSLRYAQPSSSHQNLISPLSENAIRMQSVQFPQTFTPNAPHVDLCLTDILKTRFYLMPEVPEQVFTLPVRQSQKPVPIETDYRCSAPSNWEQSKLPTNLDTLRKIAQNSSRNMLNVDIPAISPPTSLFPSYLTPPDGLVLRPMDQASIQFSTPQENHYFESAFANDQEIVPHLLHPHNEAYDQSISQDNYIGQQVRYQDVTHPETLNNVSFQSKLHSINAIHPGIQAQSVAPYGVQYQPTMLYETTFPHEDPNALMYQYGTRIFGGIPCPTDTVGSYLESNASIPDEQDPQNIVPMQTSATNPSSVSMFHTPTWPYGFSDGSYISANDPNLIPNISIAQTLVENSSSISSGHYPSFHFDIDESTSQIHREDQNKGLYSNQGCFLPIDPQMIDTNLYSSWSVSTDDEHQETAIYEKGETSKYQ